MKGDNAAQRTPRAERNGEATDVEIKPIEAAPCRHIQDLHGLPLTVREVSPGVDNPTPVLRSKLALSSRDAEETRLGSERHGALCRLKDEMLWLPCHDPTCLRSCFWCCGGPTNSSRGAEPSAFQRRARLTLDFCTALSRVVHERALLSSVRDVALGTALRSLGVREVAAPCPGHRPRSSLEPRTARELTAAIPSFTGGEENSISCSCMKTDRPLRVLLTDARACAVAVAPVVGQEPSVVPSERERQGRSTWSW